MKIHLVPIGNSKGIRIPKAILQQCGIVREVELETEGEKIIIKPVRKTPRQGWAEAFRQMAERGEDELLIDDGLDLDESGWEW
jgi:antitoxin MazE